MALPPIAASLITAPYNAIGGIQVARPSEAALAAATLALPAQMLMPSENLILIYPHPPCGGCEGFGLRPFCFL